MSKLTKAIRGVTKTAGKVLPYAAGYYGLQALGGAGGVAAGAKKLLGKGATEALRKQLPRYAAGYLATRTQNPLLQALLGGYAGPGFGISPLAGAGAAMTLGAERGLERQAGAAQAAQQQALQAMQAQAQGFAPSVAAGQQAYQQMLGQLLGAAGIGAGAGQTPEEIAMRQAQEQIAGAYGGAERGLVGALQARGLGQSSALAGALAQLYGQRGEETARMQRELALQGLQRRRQSTLDALQAAQLGMGFGPQMAGIQAQMAQAYGQRAEIPMAQQQQLWQALVGLAGEYGAQQGMQMPQAGVPTVAPAVSPRLSAPGQFGAWPGQQPSLFGPPMLGQGQGLVGRRFGGQTLTTPRAMQPPQPPTVQFQQAVLPQLRLRGMLGAY